MENLTGACDGADRHSLQAANRATAEHLAHTLKGAADDLDATELQHVADRLEAALRTGAVRSVEAHCAVCLSRLRHALKAHLACANRSVCLPHKTSRKRSR